MNWYGPNFHHLAGYKFNSVQFSNDLICPYIKNIYLSSVNTGNLNYGQEQNKQT